MAIKQLSRSQKELVAKIHGTEVTRFMGGGLDDSYAIFSKRAIQQRTMEQLVSLGYAKEISREKMNGSVEKVTYLIVDPTQEGFDELVAQVKHSNLRKAAAMEILQGGGYYEEICGLRYQTRYVMGQERLNAAWHNDWREKGLVESYDREYINGTFRGCKWRMRKVQNG